MSKAAKLFRSGALFVLSALGLSAYATNDVKAESAGKADVGGEGSVFPRYPGAQGSEFSGPETLESAHTKLIKDKMSDSLFGGNRTWRVDKNKNAPKAPSAKKDRSTR